MTGVCIDTIWKGTSPYWLGKVTTWMAFALLAGSAGTGLETNLVKKIKYMLDCSTNQKLWDISWDMWEHRNKEPHSGGQVQQQIIHSAVNNQIVIAAYASRAQQLPQEALHLLRSPIVTILEYPLDLKQLWLALIHTAQQQHQQHEFSRYHSEQQFMVTWLQTTLHPDTTNTT